MGGKSKYLADIGFSGFFAETIIIDVVTSVKHMDMAKNFFLFSIYVSSPNGSDL